MTKMMEYVGDGVTLALARLGKADIPIKYARILAKFLKAQKEEHQIAAQTYEKNKEKILAGDEEAKKQWNEYLQSEIDIEKLPKDILDKVEKICASDLLSLEPLIKN